MRTAILQITSSDDPESNYEMILPMMRRAVDQGAEMLFTPEVTNCVSMDRAHQAQVLQPEEGNTFLAQICEAAADLQVWVCLGSMAVKSAAPETRFANRSFVVSPQGNIAARYDKMHMFDVEVSPTETYHESGGYAPGSKAVLVDTPLCSLGLSICYDLRFAYLYRHLAKAGAQVLTVPSAFSVATGPAHWRPLLQARAIETGCFVIAAAQTGRHSARSGPTRQTYGHSLVVSPWGDILCDAGSEPDLILCDLDMSEVSQARAKIPSLRHDRAFEGPR